MSYMILNDTYSICQNYLQNVKNIESLNQSNLTLKIATIYGIKKLFNHESLQNLKRAEAFDVLDEKYNLIQYELIDEGLNYLMITAKNGEIKAVEALLFKFLLIAKETKDTKIIDNYFDIVIDEFSKFYDENENKSFSSNIYVHYHDFFTPFVADFFDSVIFFDDKLRNYFQVDQITDYNKTYQVDKIITATNEDICYKYDYIYRNPKNWTYEDAAKALRRFIDASFLVQSGHLTEALLSNPSSFISLKQNIDRFSVYNIFINKIVWFVINNT